jgi:hypothetical protein
MDQIRKKHNHPFITGFELSPYFAFFTLTFAPRKACYALIYALLS